MARARLALAAAFLAAAASCEPEEHASHIAFSPDGLLLAYTATASQGLRLFPWSSGQTLYLHDAITGKLLGEVAPSGVAEARFDWSPDSKAIVFTTRQFGGYDLALVRVEDRSVTPLTDHLAKDAEPCFVMGGQAVAFVSYRDGQSDLYLHTLADGSVRRLTDDGVVETSLSADAAGATLAFLSTNETGHVWLSLVRLPEAERRLNIALDPSLTVGADPIGAVRLSRDGKWLAFNSPVGVCLVDVERARRRLRENPEATILTDVLVKDTTRSSDFAFAPDGRRLAYTEAGQVRTRGLAFLLGGGRVSHPKATDDRVPAWDPSGQRIALAAPGGPVEIRDRAGRHVRWLTRDPGRARVAAKLALERGDPDQAVGLLEPLLSAGMRHEGVKDLIAAYLAAGRDEAALNLAREINDHLTEGRILLAQQRFDEALAAFQATTDPDAEVYAKTLPALDRSARSALAEAVAGELRRDDERAEKGMRRLSRSDAARGTALGADSAYRRTEVLERLAARKTGWGRKQAFKQAVAAVREALKDYPGASTETKVAALRRMKAACLDELDDRREAVNALTLLMGVLESRGRTGPGGAFPATDAEANAAAELIALCLDLNWPIEAGKVVRRVAKWSFENDANAVSLLKAVAAAYDAHGRHAAGTSALITLVGAYHLQAPNLLPLLTDALPLALAQSGGEGLDLPRLPGWAKDRAWRVVRAAPPGPAQNLALDGLNMIFAGTHPERLALWDRLAKGWRGRADAEHYRALQTAADIVLGTGCLEEGQVDAALDYFEDLARLTQREAYGRALAQYKTLRRQHPEAVAAWLDAERRTLALYVEPPLAAELAARMLAPTGAEPGTRRADVLSHWAAIYDAFLSPVVGERPRIPELEDNFLYRASQVVDGISAETYLRTLLAKYPESEFAAEAYGTLADRYEARGNYFLACTIGQTLLPSLAAHDAARVKARVALLYDSALKRDDLARPFYQDLADNYVDAPEWPDAQLWMARDEAGQGRHDQARDRLRTLIDRKPEMPAVKDGTAQYELATALRLGGHQKEADEAYLALIRNFPEHDAVKDDRALAGLWELLGEEARATIARDLPADLKRLFPHLAPEEQETLRKQYPAVLGGPATQPAP